MFQCLSRSAAGNGRNSSRGLIRARYGRGCRVDLGQPAAGRNRLAYVAGLFLVATPTLVLAEPTGPSLLPLEAADDGLGGNFNRVGDFKMPTSTVAGSEEVAIRVTLSRMYIDQDEDVAQCPVRLGLPDLQAFEGQVRYLGPPEAFNNNSFSVPKWVGAKLQCAPFYRDWSASALATLLGDGVDTDTIYYYGAEVVPCSIHAVQQATQACVESTTPEDCFSDPLEVRTALWGALWPPFNNVSFTDIGKQLEAFKSVPYTPGEADAKLPEDRPSGAPNKWRSLLRRNDGAPCCAINHTDISKVVDAFKTIAYREFGPGVEICDDGIDNNCDGAIDEDGALCGSCPSRGSGCACNGGYCRPR